MYGYLKDEEWIKGTLQSILKEIKCDESVESHWLCFDGQISSAWAQNLRKALNKSFKYLIGEKEFDLFNSKVILQEDI